MTRIGATSCECSTEDFPNRRMQFQLVFSWFFQVSALHLQAIWLRCFLAFLLSIHVHPCQDQFAGKSQEDTAELSIHPGENAWRVSRGWFRPQVLVDGPGSNVFCCCKCCSTSEVHAYVYIYAQIITHVKTYYRHMGVYYIYILLFTVLDVFTLKTSNMYVRNYIGIHRVYAWQCVSMYLNLYVNLYQRMFWDVLGVIHGLYGYPETV